MKIVRCSCCGEEVTMPSFKDRKPYGYTCFRKLFGSKSKPITYTLVSGVEVLRRWADLKESMSPEGWETKKNKYTIRYKFTFSTKKVKPIILVSEFAIMDEEGQFWIPKTNLKTDLLKYRVKMGVSAEEVLNELKNR